MNDRIALLLEAERRGILPPEKQELLNEARARGLIDASEAKIGPLEGAPEWQPKRRTLADQRADAMRPENHTPTADEEMDWGDSFAAAAGKSFRDLGLGTVQAIASGGPNAAIARLAVDSLGLGPQQNVAGLITGKRPELANPVEQWATDAINANAPIDDALMQRPGSGWGYTAGTLSQLLTPAVAASGGGPLAVRAPELASGLRALFLPRSIPGAIAQGAALGDLQPVRDGESRAQNVVLGGGAGGGGAIVGRGIGAAARVLRTPPAWSRKGTDQAAADTLRAEADDVNALLRRAPSRVPGVQRSLAEESLDPGIARLEDALRGKTNGWQALDRANNARRVEALQAIAGDEKALAAAQAAKEKAAAPLRRQVMQFADDVDTARFVSQIKRVETMMEGNSTIQKALADVRSMFQRGVPEAERKRNALAILQNYLDTGRKSSADFDAAREAMTTIRRGESPSGSFSSKSGRNALRLAKKAFGQEVAPESRMRVLMNARRQIGYMLDGKWGGDGGQALRGARELIAIRNQLDRVLGKASPEFSQYMNAERAGFREINRLLTAQRVIEKGAGSPVPGAPLSPAAYSRVAQNIDATAAAATNFPKAKAANIMRPSDMQTIADVQDDMRRQYVATTSGNGRGSATNPRDELAKRVGRNLASRVIPFFDRAAVYLEEVGQQRLNARLAEVLQQPEQARALLAAMPPVDRKALEIAISRAGGLSAIAGQRVISE